jgi:hypothetical protein
MIIYHGSNVIVRQPKILQSNRLLDFGAGFYTTPNKEQAIRWAQRVSERRKQKARILSVYNYDSEAAERDLIIIRFDEPSIEWLDFVCANRSGQEALTSYDIAIGAVADDKVYSVVQYYENGVYDKDDAIKRLKVDELYAQILFHTEKSLRYCSFTSYEELDELL